MICIKTLRVRLKCLAIRTKSKNSKHYMPPNIPYLLLYIMPRELPAKQTLHHQQS